MFFCFVLEKIKAIFENSKGSFDYLAVSGWNQKRSKLQTFPMQQGLHLYLTSMKVNTRVQNNFSDMERVIDNFIRGHYWPWDAIIKYKQRSLFFLSDLLPCFGWYQRHYLPQISQLVREQPCKFIDFSLLNILEQSFFEPARVIIDPW